jgi:hypothetical protein
MRQNEVLERGGTLEDIRNTLKQAEEIPDKK